MNIYEKLNLVQSQLKAPKGQYNSFGNFKYRSLEDIVEAAKPLLMNQRLGLTISDSGVSYGTLYKAIVYSEYSPPENELITPLILPIVNGAGKKTPL